jgi:hypothetical protein
MADSTHLVWLSVLTRRPVERRLLKMTSSPACDVSAAQADVSQQRIVKRDNDLFRGSNHGWRGEVCGTRSLRGPVAGISKRLPEA